MLNCYQGIFLGHCALRQNRTKFLALGKKISKAISLEEETTYFGANEVQIVVQCLVSIVSFHSNSYVKFLISFS